MEILRKLNNVCIQCRLCVRFSSVLWAVFVTIISIALIVTWKVETDDGFDTVHYHDILIFFSILMILGMLWMLVVIYQLRNDGLNNQERAFVPEHLLIGIMVFGLVSSALVLAEIADFFFYYRNGCGCDEDQRAGHGVFLVTEYLFIYVQIYFFYKLSLRGDRELPLRDFFLMHILGINMSLWILSFEQDTSDELEEMEDDEKKNMKTFLGSSCRKTYPLHRFVSDMEPYLYTFILEYSLIAAGLLLTIWLWVDDDGDGVNFNDALQDVERNPPDNDSYIWRFGFVMGLFIAPLVALNGLSQDFAEDVSLGNTIYNGSYVFYDVVVSTICIVGLYQLGQMVRGHLHGKLDIILLYVGMIGIFMVDTLSFVSAVLENSDSKQAISLAFSCVFQLVGTCLQTSFIHFASKNTPPSPMTPKAKAAASLIRQFSSFLFVFNICLWGLGTYAVKHYKIIFLAYKFYRPVPWFVASHIAYPLVIFYHFHAAVCFVEILGIYKKMPEENDERHGYMII